MFTRTFWRDTAERVIASAAGAAISALGVGSFGILDVDWVGVGSLAAGAAVFSLLKAIYATRRGDAESASLLSH